MRTRAHELNLTIFSPLGPLETEFSSSQICLSSCWILKFYRNQDFGDFADLRSVAHVMAVSCFIFSLF